MRRLRTRGNTLLITLIALAVLLVLVLAAIQFTGTNKEGAIAASRADEMQACATVARRVLLSKLRTVGVTTSSLQLNTQIPSAETTAEQNRLLTAHFDKNTPEPVIVALDSSVMGASRSQVREMANTLGPTTMGGSYYRVVVTCQHPGSKSQSELEFTFRHGL